MTKREMKVRCNKCGNYEAIVDNKETIVCTNCNNSIDIHQSYILDSSKSKGRLLYELENAVLDNERYKEALEEAIQNGINNNLIKYLKDKNNNTVDISYLNDLSEYKDLIIKDILKSNEFTNKQKIEYITSTNLTNKELLISIIDESNFKTEQSKELKVKLYNEEVGIVKNKSQKNGDLTYLMLIIALGLCVIIFIFGLFFEKDIARPTVVILSILPACVLGVTIAKKISTKILGKISTGIGIAIVLFFFISYIEILRIDGFISLERHLNNIIYAVPDLIDAIIERMTVVSDFEITEETGEMSEKCNWIRSL